MTLRMHHFLPCSRANGPGLRTVLWVQGCSLGCPGCFNPETHAFNGGAALSVDDLFKRIETLGGSVEGLTVSGGEPFQQLRPLTALLRRVRGETPLSIIVFTGFAWEEVLRLNRGSHPTVGSHLLQSDLLTDHRPWSGDFPVAEGGRLDSRYLLSVGSAGDSPALLGDSPSGTKAERRRHGTAWLRAGALAVPSGGSPDGTGESPVLPTPNAYESRLSEGKSEIPACRDCGAGRRNPKSELNSDGPDVLNYVDVLIAGRYDRAERVARGLRGSANKTVHLLTPRYTLDDLQRVPEAEVILSPAGDALMSGIAPLQWPAEKEGD